MKGNNQFIFCEATMMEIVQRYLNTEMPKQKPTVKGVKQNNEGSFVIQIEGNQENED